MANDFYTPSGWPPSSGKVLITKSGFKAELALIADGFDEVENSLEDTDDILSALTTLLDYDELTGLFGVSISGNADTATTATTATSADTATTATTATFADTATTATTATFADTAASADTATTADSCPTAAPPGAVMLFALSTAPTGWLKMNGAAISRAAYAALFAAIGTAFGAGDGSTTFNLPDARGEFFRCWDDSRGVDSGRVFGSWKDGTQWRSIPHGSGGLGIPNDITNNAADVSSPVIATHGNIIRISYTDYYPSGYLIPYIKPYPRNVALLACIKY